MSLEKIHPSVSTVAHTNEQQSSVRIEEDERWQLTQRILDSEGFQRAVQLRNILTYLVSAAILRPGETVREQNIALEVLGRREDFHPLDDNIVRSQMSHLRRKLEVYFREEGRAEPLKLSFPRGSYVAQFRPTSATAATIQPSTMNALVDSTPALPESFGHVQTPETVTWKYRIAVASLAGLVLVLSIALLYKSRHTDSANYGSQAGDSNAFIQILARSKGEVSVVMPDTSYMMVQATLHSDLSLQDYAKGDFLDHEISLVTDSSQRQLLSELKARRNTSVNESIVASDFHQTISGFGGRARLRYARDLRVSDLGEGNIILIGSHRSNPWNKLFEDQMNFRFTKNTNEDQYSFANTRPLPGEQQRYYPYVKRDGKQSSYVDIALTSNLTHSGYVLMINGSDASANEAAARYLLHGNLPDPIVAILTKEKLSYFEIFLRGDHVKSDAEEAFELVAVRSSLAPNQ